MIVLYVVIGVVVGAVLLVLLSKGRKDEENLTSEDEDPSAGVGCLFALIQIAILAAFGWLVLKFFGWVFG